MNRARCEMDALPGCKYDGGRSLMERATIFTAIIIEAKDFVVQLEEAFCNELWPAIRAELASSESKVKDIEKRWEERDRAELAERQRKDAERCSVLGENDALRTELEREKERFQTAVREEVERSLQRAREDDKKGKADEDRRFEEGNVALMERLRRLQGEKVEQEKQQQTLAEKVEELSEAAKVSDTKIRLLETQNQILAKTRAMSEKFHILQSRPHRSERVSPDAPVPSFSLAGKGVETVQIASRENAQITENVGRAHSPPDLHRRPGSQDCDNRLVNAPEVRSSQREAKKPVLEESTAIHVAEKHVRVARLLAASADRCHAQEKSSPVRLSPGKDAACALVGELECSQRSKNDRPELAVATPEKRWTQEDSDENVMHRVSNCSQSPKNDLPSPAVATPKEGLTKHDSDETVMYEVSDGSQRSKDGISASAGAIPEGRSTKDDSDETVMHVSPKEPLPAPGNDCPVISISSEDSTQIERTSQPYSRMDVMSKSAVPSGAASKFKLEEVERAGLAGVAPAVSRLCSPPSFRPTSSTRNAKDHPWRQTRSRTRACEGGDPHDSFLDTPREKVLAKLAATAAEQPETSGSVAIERRAGGTVQVDSRRQEAGPEVIREDVTSAKQNGKGNCGPPPPYKYNEPCRKKRDREMLQATDCMQCKRFYDAVEAEDGSGALIARCEHHDAVSRHRFRYLPPATPDGFWNIGFD